jgi:serine protease Do
LNAFLKSINPFAPKQNRRVLPLFVAAAGLVFVSFSSTELTARAAPESFADLAERLSPAVVNISTTQKVETQAQNAPPQEFQFPPGSPFEEFFKEFFDRNRQGKKNDRPRRATSLGSGFIIDKAGLVVTNNHVIQGADGISVRLADGRRFDAEVVGRDPKTDVALLRIAEKVELPFVEVGNSDKLRVGDWVMAIGNPFGLGNSVTAGIVSARGRDIQMGSYDDFIQTDASINRGNSGGPLFNMDGEVIGINTAIFSPSGGSVGIGFAIPSTQAFAIVKQLKKYGRTRRGWLGVSIQMVTEEIAEGLGLKDAKGALVAGVLEDSPAERAGLEQGDVIIEFDDKEISSMRGLPRIVAETEIGKEVDVKVWRRGEEITIDVTLGELEEAEMQLANKKGEQPAKAAGVPEKVDALGMTIAPINPEIRKKFEFPEDEQGVVVLEVDGDSAAAEKGIRAGDIIVEVSQQEVSQPDQVLKEIGKVKEAKRRSVLLLLKRAGDLRFVAVRLSDG